MAVRQHWFDSGTKILGVASSVVGMVQAGLGAVSASPSFSLLVTPKQFAWLSVINIALGGMVLRRGFTNTRRRRRRC